MINYCVINQFIFFKKNLIMLLVDNFTSKFVTKKLKNIAKNSKFRFKKSQFKCCFFKFQILSTKQ